jgi:hypothetical protein
MFFPRLTKSLHTVTAVANVARYIAPSHRDHVSLARESLAILGYSMADYPPADPTIQKILRECSRIVGARARVAA